MRHAAAAESGEKNPSAEALCRFVRALGVSADLIAYPEAEYTVSDEAPLVRLIRACDVRDRRAIKAMADSCRKREGICVRANIPMPSDGIDKIAITLTE